MGIDSVCVAGDIDPAYRQALLEAQAGGVEIMAWKSDVSPVGIVLSHPVPFSVD
jgi:sugar fermentation stimulation protein A